MNDNIYNAVKQEYYRIDNEKKNLVRECENIKGKLEIMEAILLDFNDILCKYGNHIYEHFEEKEV